MLRLCDDVTLESPMSAGRGQPDRSRSAGKQAPHGRGGKLVPWYRQPAKALGMSQVSLLRSVALEPDGKCRDVHCQIKPDRNARAWSEPKMDRRRDEAHCRRGHPRLIRSL